MRACTSPHLAANGHPACTGLKSGSWDAKEVGRERLSQSQLTQGTADNNEKQVETWPKSLSWTSTDQMVHLAGAG